MRQHELLYDWPIAAITRLSDSPEANAFAADLEEVEQEKFATLTEAIRNVGPELARSKANRDVYADWYLLRDALSALSSAFEGYQPALIDSFRIYILLVEKMAAVAESIEENEVDAAVFQLREISSELPVSWFVYQNTRDIAQSAVILNKTNVRQFSDELDASTISPELLYHLLALLYEKEELAGCHFAMVKATADPVAAEAVDAFCRVLVLATGVAVHKPVRYRHAISVVDKDVFQLEHIYHQWNEVLNVLSEYNNHDDLLLKYLVIYHVVENLMFKLPIVKLEREKAGHMFSIRDFQRLYTSVKQSERPALVALFKTFVSANATPTETFSARIVNRWNNIVPGVATADLERSLSELGVTNGGGPFRFGDFQDNGACADHFASMVYAVRCAVVHNKETELHLTHTALDAGSEALIRDFLIPSLEEICFYLIGSPNNDVWYDSKQLMLYS